MLCHMRFSERNTKYFLLQVLLGQGSSIRSADKAGHTPLHYAAAGELHTKQLLHVNLDEHSSRLSLASGHWLDSRELKVWHMQGVKQVP